MLRTLKHLADTVRAMLTMLTLFRYIQNEFIEEMLCVFHSHTTDCMRHSTVGVMPNRSEVFPEEPALPLRKITAVVNLLDSILVTDFQNFHFCFPVLSLQFFVQAFRFFLDSIYRAMVRLPPRNVRRYYMRPIARIYQSNDFA